MENMQFDNLRSEYIRLRQTGSFSSDFFYRYYQYKGGDLGFQEFNMIFKLGSFHDVLNGMDKIFSVNKVLDKNGELLRIVD
jgi:hypothetical protein